MMELAFAFLVFVLFSLGVDYMIWNHFHTIYEAQYQLTDKLIAKLEQKPTGPTGVSGHTELGLEHLFIDPAGISGGIGEEE